jgi:hypothetical protein
MTKSINNTKNTIKEKDEEQQKQQSSLNSINKNSTNIILHKLQESSLTQENQTPNVLLQYKRRQKFEMTTGEYDYN